MGDWRTVFMVGRCAPEHVAALREAITPGEDYRNFHCLVNSGGLCGIWDWAAESILAVGNLAERNYTVENVAARLALLLKVAPSLELKVHCGGDYESVECIATITVSEGKVTIAEPEILKLPEISEEQVKGRLFDVIHPPRKPGQ